MYSCGPTVNAEPTLGLLRRVVVSDLLRRYLEYCGYEVKHVMNSTDIDDNTIQESQRQGISLKELTDRYTQEFLWCVDELGMKRAWKSPRASEHVDDMAAFTQRLVDKGFNVRLPTEKIKAMAVPVGIEPSAGMRAEAARKVPGATILVLGPTCRAS